MDHSDSDDTAVIEENKPTTTFKTMRSFIRWNFIQKILNKMAMKQLNSSQIEINIIKFHFFSKRERRGTTSINPDENLKELMKLYGEQLPQIFSKIAIFMLKKLPCEYPLFQQRINLQHTFTKSQVMYLFCSMVLCLIPRQTSDQQRKTRELYHSQFDFFNIFASQRYKTQTIIQFIKKEINNVLSQKNQDEQKLTIRRQFKNVKIQQLIQSKAESPMCKIMICKNDKSIEEFYGILKVDFANRYIGGGALGYGCVQEQIMFANHPQLYITQLLCQYMLCNQAIIMIGFKKYSKNSGYSYETKYDGQQTHIYEYDGSKRAKQYITAIDAQAFTHSKIKNQYRRQNYNREILKAYIGFSSSLPDVHKIVTGNWGCGAFGGDIRIKLLIQWLSCSLAGKQFIYCPFGQLQKVKDHDLLLKIGQMSIGDFYEALVKSSLKVYNLMIDGENQLNIFDKMKALLLFQSIKENKE